MSVAGGALTHVGNAAAIGADFAASFNSDFAINYTVVFDPTVLLINTDDGSSITSVASVYFGQASGTLPRFTGDQVQVSSTLNFSSGNIVTPAQFNLAQVFSPSYANGYICAFYTNTGVNYRVLITASALLSATPLSGVARLEFRWGNISGFANTFMAGGVTTYTDSGSAGSNQSSATTPSGTYTSTTSQCLFLEKIGIVP